MSRSESPTFEPSGTFDDRLDDPDTLRFPDEWKLSGSWQRAQREADRGGPINDAERMVWLDESDEPHRVTFALDGQRLLADCDCRGYRFNRWCAHVASCWWRWSRGEIAVQHLQTGREYPEPPAWFRHDPLPRAGLDDLTPAELDAYLHCDVGGEGVRAFARRTDRAAGTVGNLLTAARETMGGVRR
ncbi:SWIM zinc finger family protein [Halomicrobium mukohataei]|uniref:SWIM zinc finger family protein n=1 Tax=Halomicrobium mukohataei TaxID=57705 RepID=A0A847UD98_9EURY|nr:SWIM zinc finger family protein [Halomicrobium mukohataei]NLV09344.1 SWIM zinc finger family protein [Halomicrobium mukohataei]